MRSKVFQLALACLFVMPIGLQAQTHINSVLNNLVEKYGKKVQDYSSKNPINVSHNEEKDPTTLALKFKSDVYTIKQEIKNPKVLDNLMEAFDKDKAQAYSNYEGDRSSNLFIAGNTLIGQNYDHYRLLTFNDPQDKTFRYAYSLEWDDADENGNINARVIRDYRKHTTDNINKINKWNLMNDIFSQDSEISTKINKGLDNQITGATLNSNINHKDIENSGDWLAKFNTYKILIEKTSNDIASSYYVSSIYNLCKNDGDMLSSSEIAMVNETLNKLMKEVKDDVQKAMLNSCIELLKKKQ